MVRTARYETPTDLEALFEQIQPLVRRLVHKYGTTPDLRQELPGEIYHRFSALVAAFDPNRGIPLEAYLARNLTAAAYTYARSHWTRQKREVSLDAQVAPERFLCSDDPSGRWDQDLMNRELVSTFTKAIAQLPKRQREALIWRFYEGKSHAEIAVRLNTCPANSRSLLRHALNGLRRSMAHCEG